MVSTVQNSFERGVEKQKQELSKEPKVKDDEIKDDEYINPPDAGNEFDFVEAYDDDPIENDELLPDNSASSAINCAFVGVGGGGGKLAKAFLDLGFNKTLLVNTTLKDLPPGIDDQHVILIPGADGVGKDIALGKKVLCNNSTMVEDALRSKIGKADWVFVLAGGGGGTGSACVELHNSISRYLSSSEASGKVVYVISKPTAQELLNPTISTNYDSALQDVSHYPHIVIDNEKQLQLLRGKVGMLNMFPAANKNFAKLLSQVLKLADEASPIQTFDSKDLEKCLGVNGRMVIGSTVIRDVSKPDLGAAILQGTLKSSPCPGPAGNTETGVLLLIANSEMASDPNVSKKLESAFSYVGGRANTLFSGVYVKEGIPGLVAITLLGGI
ncbi:hypothetical protein CL614_09450 [archaeon]|nr:hypothetical protein [archaeon]|tara:strand:+ start:73 stop:1227 length:1155 start_codon:yes stop_codon:yes gene_type:complete